MNIKETLKNHAMEWVLGSLFFTGLLYSVTTSWKSASTLEYQQELILELHSDLKNLKKSIVGLLLDGESNKSEIIKGLFSDSRTLQGIDNFKAGELHAAYALWIPSAKAGSDESAFAIAAANLSLKQMASDPSLSQEQRERAKALLENVPEVDWDNGTYTIRDDQK